MDLLAYWSLLICYTFVSSETPSLIVSSVLTSPFLMEEKGTNGNVNKTYRGYIIDLLEELKKKVDFDYDIEISPDGTFGREITPGNWSGTLNEVIQKEVLRVIFIVMFYLTVGSSEGDIYCGDLGEGEQEEIDFIQKGHNYGWNIKEGNKCVSDFCNVTGPEGRPVYVYDHPQGPAAVIGGYVYRGNSMKNLTGRYIFADIFANSFLYTLEKMGVADWEESHLYYCDPSFCPCHARETLGQDYLVSFSQDNKGEVYLLSTKSFHGKSTDDRLLKLVPPNSYATTCGAPALTCHWKTISIFLSLTFNLMIKKVFDLTFIS